MSLDDTDETSKKRIDETFKVMVTSEELGKRAKMLGFELEIDEDTDIASLYRTGDKDGWSIYRGHWESVLPWLHGYAIAVLYLGHL